MFENGHVKIPVYKWVKPIYKLAENENRHYWVTVKIGINGLYPNLYRNKHRINPE
jgi:hypothetical protein